MRNAGSLDRRIIIERYNEDSRDEYNEPVGDWELYTKVSASRRDVSDSEKISAGQINATRMSRFVVRYSAKVKSVTAKDRLNYDGLLWDIHGIKETSEGRKRFLEITAMARAD